MINVYIHVFINAVKNLVFVLTGGEEDTLVLQSAEVTLTGDI